MPPGSEPLGETVSDVAGLDADDCAGGDVMTRRDRLRFPSLRDLRKLVDRAAASPLELSAQRQKVAISCLAGSLEHPALRPGNRHPAAVVGLDRPHGGGEV